MPRKKKRCRQAWEVQEKKPPPSRQRPVAGGRATPRARPAAESSSWGRGEEEQEGRSHKQQVRVTGRGRHWESPITVLLSSFSDDIIRVHTQNWKRVISELKVGWHQCSATSLLLGTGLPRAHHRLKRCTAPCRTNSSKHLRFHGSSPCHHLPSPPEGHRI